MKIVPIEKLSREELDRLKQLEQEKSLSEGLSEELLNLKIRNVFWDAEC